MLVTVFVVFDIELRGSITLVVLLTVSQGMAGMSFGFCISAVCDEEQSAIMMALGSFYPNLLLSGIIWPLEGMPPYLRAVAYFLPQTMAIRSLRSIINRAFGLTYPSVYLGFLSTFSWILVFCIVATIIFTIRK